MPDVERFTYHLESDGRNRRQEHCEPIEFFYLVSAKVEIELRNLFFSELARDTDIHRGFS